MVEEKLTREEQGILLKAARQTILNHISRRKAEKAEACTERLGCPGGAFVTLHKHGGLRGCIGTFTSQRPLIHTVQEMAVSASQHDPRFPSVRADEMQEIDLEISVLSPLREIQDVSEIEVGRHGIYITRGFHSGVLLPQVATEQGWDRETFLQHTCLKAGLPPDAWQKTGTKIEVFEAQVFGDQEGGEET